MVVSTKHRRTAESSSLCQLSPGRLPIFEIKFCSKQIESWRHQSLPFHSNRAKKLKKHKHYTIWETLTDCSLTLGTWGRGGNHLRLLMYTSNTACFYWEWREHRMRRSLSLPLILIHEKAWYCNSTALWSRFIKAHNVISFTDHFQYRWRNLQYFWYEWNIVAG